MAGSSREQAQLRGQLAAVQRIKAASDQKDAVISSLRREVSDLLRFKEEAFNLQAQLALAEEKAKLRQAEESFRVAELEDRLRRTSASEHELRTQLQSVEDDRAAAQRLSAARIADLEAHLAAVQQDSLRRETARAKLEEELVMVSQLAHSHSAAKAEVERSYQQQARQLQDNAARLFQTTQEQADAMSHVQGQLERARRDIEERDREITRLRHEYDKAATARQTALSEVGSLQNRAAQAEARAQHLELDLGSAEEARRAAASVPALQRELEMVQRLLSDAKAEAERERRAAAAAVAERDAARAETAQQTSLRDQAVAAARAEAASAPSPVATDAWKSQLESLQRELTWYQTAYERARRDLLTLPRAGLPAAPAAAAANTSAISGAAAEVSAASGAAPNPAASTSVVSGASAPHEHHERDDGVRYALIALQGMVEDVLAGSHTVDPDVSAARLARARDVSLPVLCRTLESRVMELLSQHIVLRSTGADHPRDDQRLSAEVVAQLQASSEAQARAAEAQVSASTARARIVELEAQAARHQDTAELERERVADAVALLRAALHIPADTAATAASDNDADLAASSVQRLTRVVGTVVTRIAELQGAAETKDLQLAALKADLQQEQQQHAAAVAALRDDLSKAQQDAQAVQAQLDERTAAAASVDASVKATAARLQEAEASRAQLSAVVSLLVRALRPLRVRVQDLAWQKTLLARTAGASPAADALFRLARLAVPGSGVVGSARTRFRVAVIAIMASSRLRDQRHSGRFLGLVGDARHSQCALLPVDDASLVPVPDVVLPTLERPDAASASVQDQQYLLFRVLQRLDPEHAVVLDNALAMSLPIALRAGATRRADLDVDAAAACVASALRSLKRDASAAAASAAALQTSVQEQEATIALHVAKIDELQQRVADLAPRSDVADAQAEAQAASSEVASLRQRVQDLQQQLDEANYMAAELQTSLRDGVLRQQQLEEAKTAAEAAAAAEQAQQRSMHAFMRRKSDELTAAQQGRRRIEHALHQARQELQAGAVAQQQLREHVAALDSRVRSKADTVARLEASVLELERERGLLQEQLDRLRDAHAETQRELEAAREFVRESHAAHSSAMEQIALLRRQVASYKDLNAGLTHELQQSQQRDASDQQDRHDFEAVRADLSRLRSAAETDVAAAVASLSTT